MTKYLIANIMTLLFIPYLSSKDPLELLNTNLRTKKQTDKYWLKYMFKLTEVSGLAHLFSSSSLLTQHLKILKTGTHINNIIKYHNVKINKIMKFAIYICTFVLYTFKAFGEITYFIESKQTHVETSMILHHRIWHFSPNKKFRIRIIFINLKIHHNYRSCMQNITVCTSSLKMNNNQNVCEYDKLVFCGDYSMFYFYSPHSTLYFNLFYMTSPFFKLDVSFDLMSNNIIHNICLKLNYGNKYQIFYNILFIKTLLHIFYIKVSKFEQININLNVSIKMYNI